jgi:hypothetical protein
MVANSGCDHIMTFQARSQKFSRKLKSRVLGRYIVEEGLGKVVVPAKTDLDFVDTTFIHEQAHQQAIHNTIYGYILTALARLSVSDQLPQDERNHWGRCYEKLASGAFNCLEGHAVTSEILIARLKGKESEIIDRLSPDYRQAFDCFRPILRSFRFTNETRVEWSILLRSVIDGITEYALDRGFFTLDGLPADFDGILAKVVDQKKPDAFLQKSVKLVMNLEWFEVDKVRRERISHHFGNINIDDLPNDILTLEPLTKLVLDTTLIIKQCMSVLERGEKPLANLVADTVISHISTVRTALQKRWPGMNWPSFDPDRIADITGQSALIFPQAQIQYKGKGLTLEAFKDRLEHEEADAERVGAVLRFYRKINGLYDIIAHPISVKDKLVRECAYFYYIEDLTANDITYLDDKWRDSKHLWQTFYDEKENKLFEADLISRLTLPVFLYRRLFSDAILRGIIDRKVIGAVKCVRIYSFADGVGELNLRSLEVVAITDNERVHVYWVAKSGLLGSEHDSFFGLPIVRGEYNLELGRVVLATISMERGEDIGRLPHY